MAKAASTHAHTLPLRPADTVNLGRCPICGSDSRVHISEQTYGQGNAVHHFRCDGCGLIYMDPVPTQDWYDRLYADEFWEVKSARNQDSSVGANAYQWRKGLTRADKYLDLLRAHASATAISSVLEIGASFGLIGTTVADAYGAHAFGVEPNHAAREFASRHAGMTMVAETTSDLDAWTPEQPVDLVIFSHVLENIINPDSALSAVRRKLRSGGLLLVETPNAQWQPSMSIYHPYCFSVEAIRILLERNGFDVRIVHRSGRPTSLVLPRYLTLVAEKSEAARESPRTTGNVTADKVRRNHGISRKFIRSVFGKIDTKICTMIYPKGLHSKTRLKEFSRRTHFIEDG